MGDVFGGRCVEGMVLELGVRLLSYTWSELLKTIP